MSYTISVFILQILLLIIQISDTYKVKLKIKLI